MKRTSFIIVILLAAFCASAFAQADNKKPVAAGAKEYSDPSQVVMVKTGETFCIVLDSNATTGYSWDIVKKVLSPVIKFAGKEYMQPGKELAGAPGKERWTFNALSAGTITLTFNYIRPWEKEKKPARTATFKITVK